MKNILNCFFSKNRIVKDKNFYIQQIKEEVKPLTDKRDFYLTNEIVEFALTEHFKKYIRQRCESMGYIPLENEHKIKVFGYYNDLIENVKFLEFDKLNETKLKELYISKDVNNLLLHDVIFFLIDPNKETKNTKVSNAINELVNLSNIETFQDLNLLTKNILI